MSAPIAKTKQGQVKGKVCEDYDGNEYFAFLGIPYAKPPLGDLRFKAPLPAESWEGIRDATENGAECYSRSMVLKKLDGSEDCLFLNVFTNELPVNKNNFKPVMVWIHGGGFHTGSNNTNLYGPDFLICEDVVIVSINYRLGVLGFLSLNDPKLGVPGNAGLKDMVLALKWVKNNIQYFNGDPNNVTIFGESAGGAAAHLLMLSPMATGLFHKVIALSGSATNLWGCCNSGPEEVAEALGYKSTDELELLKFLQNVSKEELVHAQMKCSDEFLACQKRSYGPVVEKWNHYEECFLQDQPYNIILSGNYNKVPLIMGYTSREGMLFEFIAKELNKDLQITNFEKYVPFNLNLPEGSPLSLEIASRIRNFYFGDKDPNTEESKDNFYKLNSDIFFTMGICNSARNHVKTSNTPVYLYRFSTESDLNIFKKLCETKNSGVCHGDDMGYLFKCILTPEIRPGSLEEISMKRFVKYLTNFAKLGDPNPKELDEHFPILWKPVTKDSLNFIDINENLTVGTNPENNRMKFWDSIYNIYPVPGYL